MLHLCASRRAAISVAVGRPVVEPGIGRPLTHTSQSAGAAVAGNRLFCLIKVMFQAATCSKYTHTHCVCVCGRTHVCGCASVCAPTHITDATMARTHTDRLQAYMCRLCNHMDKCTCGQWALNSIQRSFFWPEKKICLLCQSNS